MIQIDMIEEVLCNKDVYYAFRNKRTQLYIGYDGFDTDFARGISPIIKELDIIAEFNKRLLIKTRLEIIDMLVNQPMGSKVWTQLGGIASVEIVRFEMTAEGTVFTPSDLVRLVSSEETEVDYCE